MVARKKTPRERILDAALEVFAANGAGASSIQDVAEAAGMSKQALLHHFRTKELLRAGVYGLLATRLRDQLPAAAAELVSRSHDRYRGLIEVVQRRFNDNPELTRFLVFELLERPDAVLAWLSEETAPWLGLIRGVVDQSKDVAPGFDAEAHLSVLAVMMLAQSALIPRKDARWRKRVEAATLRVMFLGSLIAPG
jgi:TetR/AcrR family transcriptional regulator